MSDGAYFDPVADGLPSKYTRIEITFIAVMLALAVWDAHRGAWGEVLDAVLFAVIVYVAMRHRRGYWLSGYRAAIESIAEPADSIEVTND